MTRGDYKHSWERVREVPKPEAPPELTPTKQEVRWVYSYGVLERWEDDILILRAKAQGFDRWLASVRADAWDEGHAVGFDVARYMRGVVSNPYRGEKQ